MKIKTLKQIRLQSGKVPVGTVLDLPDVLAQMFLSRAEAERYVEPAPIQAAGTPSSASPAAPASPQQTSKQSRRGDTRGRPKKIAES